MQITTVRLDQVQPHPHNIRRDVGDVTELADSMRETGLVQPIVVAPAAQFTAARKKSPKFTLIAGHRRFAAAKVCGWAEIDAILRDDLDTEAKQIETMAIENLQRQDLTPVEEARGYQQLLDLGYTPQKIAKQTGRNVKTVKLRIGLNKLSAKASDKLHAGQITIEQAEVLASFAKNPKAYAELEKSIGTSNFAWKVNEVKAKQKKEADRKKLVEQLRDEGVTLIDRPKQYPWDLTVKPLSNGVWVGYGLDVDPAEHASCPGHAAIIVDDYRGVWIDYVCRDPKGNGHAANASSAAASEPMAAPAESPDQVARRKRTEDLRVAEVTRREFVKTFLATRKLSSAAQMAALRAAVTILLEEISEYAEIETRLDVLGVSAELEDDARIARVEQMVIDATDAAALIRLVFACVYGLSDPGVSLFDGRPQRAALSMLMHAGYELCDVELEELERTAPASAVEDVVPSGEFADAI
jgi:ParB family chromosome partitioning protein